MKKKIYLWLFGVFLSTLSVGQSKDVRNSFFVHLKNFEFSKAQMICHEVTELPIKSSLILLQKILFESGQKDSMAFMQDSLKIKDLESKIPGSHDGQIILKLLWGYHFFFTNPYTEKPIDNFTNAYRLAREKGTIEELKFSIYSIITMYNWQLSQTNDEILHYLDLHEQLIEDKSDQFLNKMGRFIYELKDEKMIINISEDSIRNFQELMLTFEIEHHYWIEFYITLGVYRKYQGFKYHDMARVDEGERLLQFAAETMDFKPYLRYLKFRTYTQLSQISAYKKEYSAGLNYVSKAKEYGYKNDDVRTKYHLNWYRAPNLFGLGKKDSAYFALAEAANLKSRLGIEQNNLHTSHYQWKFQTEEKERKLLEQQRELLMNEQQLLLERESKAQSRNISIILVIVLFLGLVISALVYRDTKRKELLAIQEKDIQSQKVTSLLKDQELVSLNAMIEGQEIERKRIAEDLHDRLGSTLSAVKMYMDVLAEDDPRYSKVNAIVDKAVNDTREIAHNMLSGVLSKFGLLAALRDLKQTIEEANQFKINLSSIQFDQRLESETELHIYRIVQELISNTLKHAHASVVDIELRKTGDEILTITYQDNGKGFESSTDTDGMGLRNIESRLAKVQGNWTITSAPMKGVRAIIQIKTRQ